MYDDPIRVNNKRWQKIKKTLKLTFKNSIYPVLVQAFECLCAKLCQQNLKCPKLLNILNK